jgi:hypothetical protein
MGQRASPVTSAGHDGHMLNNGLRSAARGGREGPVQQPNPQQQTRGRQQHMQAPDATLQRSSSTPQANSVSRGQHSITRNASSGPMTNRPPNNADARQPMAQRSGHSGRGQVR